MCAAWQRNVAHSSIETEISSEAASKIAILTTSCVSSDFLKGAPCQALL